MGRLVDRTWGIPDAAPSGGEVRTCWVIPSRLRVHALILILVVVLVVDAVTIGEQFARGWPVAAIEQQGVRSLAVDAAPIAGSAPSGASAPTVPRPRPEALEARLAAAGYDVPPGASVYAVRVNGGGGLPLAYDTYQAGEGALAENFWPASSIKVLAALGALDFARSLGFTGAATVTFDDGRDRATIRAIYRAAIAQSSNFDYDSLVKIAGVDRLNSAFLTQAKGFPVTSIFQSYAGDDLSHSPGMTLQEGTGRTYVPARFAKLAPKCASENCSNLLELTESVRRVVLHDELPPTERFDIAPADVAALKGALGHADGFFPDAVAAVLGAGALIYDKPGDVAGRDCLDVAFIESSRHQRFLLAASVPHSSGGCNALTTLATGVLHILAPSRSERTP